MNYSWHLPAYVELKPLSLQLRRAATGPSLVLRHRGRKTIGLHPGAINIARHAARAVGISIGLARRDVTLAPAVSKVAPLASGMRWLALRSSREVGELAAMARRSVGWGRKSLEKTAHPRWSAACLSPLARQYAAIPVTQSHVSARRRVASRGDVGARDHHVTRINKEVPYSPHEHRGGGPQ